MNKYQIEEQIISEQKNKIERPDFSFDRFFQEQKKREEAFDKKVGGKKVDYEYQEIGLAMENWFGKKCWFIFYRPEAELQKVKEAFAKCRAKGIRKIEYLIGCLK